MPHRKPYPWRPGPHQTAPGKPGAVHIAPMLDIHTTPTPNGIKIPIAAEELGIPYRIMRQHLPHADQRRPELLATNSDGRFPAIVDHDVPG